MKSDPATQYKVALEEIAAMTVPDSNDAEHDMLMMVLEIAQTALAQKGSQ